MKKQLLSIALVCLTQLGQAAPKPNVIYIIADDLGYGDLSIYGQTNFSTPNIDAIAKRGILFKQHYSAAPVCAPARGSLMTGLHVGHGAVRGNSEVEPEGQQPMPADTFTLAHLFKQAGYAGKNEPFPPLTSASPRLLFDFFPALMSPKDLERTHAKRR